MKPITTREFAIGKMAKATPFIAHAPAISAFLHRPVAIAMGYR